MSKRLRQLTVLELLCIKGLHRCCCPSYHNGGVARWQQKNKRREWDMEFVCGGCRRWDFLLFFFNSRSGWTRWRSIVKDTTTKRTSHLRYRWRGFWTDDVEQTVWLLGRGGKSKSLSTVSFESEGKWCRVRRTIRVITYFHRSACARSHTGLEKDSVENVEIQRRRKFYAWYFKFKMPDVKLQKDLREVQVIALMSVLSKWYDFAGTSITKWSRLSGIDSTWASRGCQLWASADFTDKFIAPLGMAGGSSGRMGDRFLQVSGCVGDSLEHSTWSSPQWCLKFWPRRGRTVTLWRHFWRRWRMSRIPHASRIVRQNLAIRDLGGEVPELQCCVEEWRNSYDRKSKECGRSRDGRSCSEGMETTIFF